MSAFFIVFEGPDGSGTTRHSQILAGKLRAEGKDVVLTKEPTDGKCGQKIRSVLKEGLYMDPADLQKLFSDDRAEHVEHVIQPALNSGKIVITDRYRESTFVYGEASCVSISSLRRWNQDLPKPDLLFFLLPPFEVCFDRLMKREEQDAFEKERFQKKVYDGYMRYAEEHPDVHIFDTSQEKKVCDEEVWKRVLQFISI